MRKRPPLLLIPYTPRKDYIETKDRRQNSLIMDVNKYASNLLRDLHFPEIKVCIRYKRDAFSHFAYTSPLRKQVDGILFPMHDCTFDGAHYDLAVCRIIVKKKILPWICRRR
jgi:hypothetical protein